MEILGHSGVLAVWAQVLGQVLQGSWNTVLALGLLSAIVDNIPLVSAGMQMFDLVQFPKDDLLWVLLSYCAGTGGSLLIVGSAAGLVAMGQEGLKFNWYMRHFTWKVLLAYGAGAALFALLAPL
jgi:Na+/H+ antiporter NhaD/arsenite permease-like protein